MARSLTSLMEVPYKWRFHINGVSRQWCQQAQCDLMPSAGTCLMGAHITGGAHGALEVHKHT